MTDILKDWDSAAQYLNQRIDELSDRIKKLESIEIATLSLEETEDVVEETEAETVPEVSEETEAEA